MSPDENPLPNPKLNGDEVGDEVGLAVPSNPGIAEQVMQRPWCERQMRSVRDQNHGKQKNI